MHLAFQRRQVGLGAHARGRLGAWLRHPPFVLHRDTLAVAIARAEDAARNRKDNSPGNIAVLRRRALDVMRRDTSNGSLSIKLKRAGWDDDFLRSVLNNLAP